MAKTSLRKPETSKVGRNPAQTNKKSNKATLNKPNLDYVRAEGDPFRPGSSYSIAFSALKKSAGMTRQQLVAEVAKATGKDERHAGYDVAVLLSAKDSPTGPRHQSCREGFWIEREGDHIRLRTA